MSDQSNVTSAEKDRTTSSVKTENSEDTGPIRTGNDSLVKIGSGVPSPMLEVYTISDMNKLLHHSRTLYHSVVCLKSSSFMLFPK